MKILTLDVETCPHLSYHFGRWQQNIPPENTVSESRVICWAAKWHGKKGVMFGAEWKSGEFMDDLWHLLDEADVVVGFNQKKFDIRRINTEFLRAGTQPPSPYEQVDLLQQVKKHFGFSSNRLKHLLKELGLSQKLEENVGMKLWVDVAQGDPRAQSHMEKYNKQDVKSTEEFYDFLLGWISGHPNHGLYVEDVDNDTPVCPNCGSTDLHKHKVRRTKVRKYQQYQCQDCGSYSRGRKSLTTVAESGHVLA